MNPLKIAYIVHEYGGKQENLEKVKKLIAKLSMEDLNIIPYCPWYAYISCLDENKWEQRARGLYMTLHLLNKNRVDELHVYANELSEGVRLELHKAATERILIRNYGSIPSDEIKNCLKEQGVDITVIKVAS